MKYIYVSDGDYIGQREGVWSKQTRGHLYKQVDLTILQQVTPTVPDGRHQCLRTRNGDVFL